MTVGDGLSSLRVDPLDCDPRMVELVRLLARRAAREVYEEQMKERRPPRS